MHDIEPRAWCCSVPLVRRIRCRTSRPRPECGWRRVAAAAPRRWRATLRRREDHINIMLSDRPLMTYARLTTPHSSPGLGLTRNTKSTQPLTADENKSLLLTRMDTTSRTPRTDVTYLDLWRASPCWRNPRSWGTWPTPPNDSPCPKACSPAVAAP